MEDEILCQPAVLAANAQTYFDTAQALRDRPFDMVLLAARGSSDNAALFARYLFEIHLQVPVSLAAPSVITRYKSEVRYPRCLTIGVSQSGAAPDVAEVLAYMRRQGHPTLAVTNTPGSRLTQEAEHSILLSAGPEKAVAATKTYTSTLLALYQVVRALGGSLPEPVLFDDGWVQTCRRAAESALGPILRCPTLFALARGYSFCTAQETALKLMECALLACKSYSTADFEHGPKALAGHGSAALVYGSDVPKVADQGSLVVRAPEFGQGPCDPWAEIVFGQWCALLAARARGLDPDRPQHLSKVTETL